MARPGAGRFLAAAGPLACAAGLYLLLHALWPVPRGGLPLWLGSLPGRLAECGAWLALGGLISVLEAGAAGRPAHAGRTAAGLAAGAALLALLRLGLAALERLPGEGWLAVEPAALVAGTGLPLAFALGLAGRRAGLRRPAGGLRGWLRGALAATFRRL